MSNETKKINEEKLARVLEVLNILGGKLPENYDFNQEHITLSGEPDTTSENYIEIDGDFITILLNNNDHRYIWICWEYEKGSIHEDLGIDWGSLHAVFFEKKEATVTSGFYLYSTTWGSPHINCSINSSSMREGVFPVDSYYDIFASYMSSKKTTYKNALADDPDIEALIIKMFGRLIKEHVFDLKNNDQSWRFDSEREEIQSNYEKSVKYYEDKYKKAKEKADKDYEHDKILSEEVKNSRTIELEKLQEQYAHKTK